MTNSVEFLNAVNAIKQSKENVTHDDLENLYGLYKQATVGDNNTEKPSFFNLVGVKKWNGWNKYKNMSTIDAEKAYISYVNKIIKG
jgi:diazepam-binding inhibitor (GABA receptor modulating acyl-CoA-binding protein)